jgi:hypothetical protein
VRAILAGLCLASTLWFATQVSATVQAASPSTADAVLSAQKSAFLGLPESVRKAAQDALVWLGFYNGVSDGAFGPRTRDAIAAFQKSLGASADGMLSQPELAALLAAAQKAREAVGFQTLTDPKTGARIGAPVKLMAGRSGARLEFASSADPDLAALYARLTAATPNRKTSYKAIKPDAFFVVSGQDGSNKFYSRFEKNAAANPPIRGFTFSYPADAIGAQGAKLAQLAVAVADSFNAFPAPPGSASPPVGSSETVRPPAGPPSTSPQPSATALVIAPGKAVTALTAADCARPTIAGKSVRVERGDPATGLALLDGEFSLPSDALSFGDLSPNLIVLGYGASGLATSPAFASGGEARPTVVASLDQGASGAPVFDRAGALIALVAPIDAAPRRVGGVALAAPHALIAPAALRAFLAEREAKAAADVDLSAGEIAARRKGELVAVFCDK